MLRRLESITQVASVATVCPSPQKRSSTSTVSPGFAVVVEDDHVAAVAAMGKTATIAPINTRKAPMEREPGEGCMFVLQAGIDTPRSRGKRFPALPGRQRNQASFREQVGRMSFYTLGGRYSLFGNHPSSAIGRFPPAGNTGLIIIGGGAVTIRWFSGDSVITTARRLCFGRGAGALEGSVAISRSQPTIRQANFSPSNRAAGSRTRIALRMASAIARKAVLAGRWSMRSWYSCTPANRGVQASGSTRFLPSFLA